MGSRCKLGAISRLTAACVGLLIASLVIVSLNVVEAGEMTFELPDKEKMCFHEIVKKGVSCVLEYQVIQGGNYDVDLTLMSPRGTSLYAEQKKQYDRHEWVAEEDGVYQFCFSNEFSTFTHKLVYFDLQVGAEGDLPLGTGNPITAMTQMESSALNLHQSLKMVIDYQTHHRLRESQGRSFAEDVNERVSYWSVGLTLIIVAASVGQIMVLRSFFTDRKNVHTAHIHS